MCASESGSWMWKPPFPTPRSSFKVLAVVVKAVKANWVWLDPLGFLRNVCMCVAACMRVCMCDLMEARSWCLISKFWDKVVNSARPADQRAPCSRSASPSLRLQVHIWPFLWVQWLQTQVLGLVWQALCPLSPLPTPNFTVAQILPSPPKHCTGIQSPLGCCKIMIDEVVSHRLSKSALKDHGRVWKEPDSCQLPAVLCGCLLASLSFSGYKKDS